MFDNLHDPNPPTGDSQQFAAVAERARSMRNKRTAAFGTVGAIALIAAGAVVVTTTNRADDRDLVTTASPETSPLSTIEITAPSTTLLTPATVPATTDVSPPGTSDTTTTTTTATATQPSVVGDAIPLACGEFHVCTFDTLADGRLVQIGTDRSEAGPPSFTIYDSSGANVDASGMLGNFDPLGAWLVDIGPGDIAYVWYLPRDEIETARMGAFELTGSNAGRQIIEFDTVLDFSGDTEQLPTRDGFVNVGCCGPDPVRPAADAVVVIPWVNSDGETIINEVDTFFGIELVEQTLTIRATRNGEARSWERVDQEAGPRGVPALYQLDDGRVLHLFEPLHSGDRNTVPVYLNPDGSTDVAESPGIIEFVLPDGRAVLEDPVTGAQSLLMLAAPAFDAPVRPSAPLDPVVPPRPLVAITADGDAVYFDGADQQPTVILDGPAPDEIDPDQEGPGPNLVDSIAVSGANNVGYVGECCEPVSGVIFETALPTPIDKAVTRQSLPGYGVSVSPDGQQLAVGGFSGVDVGIQVLDIATGDETDYRTGEQTTFFPFDTMWVNDSTVALLGTGDSGWELAVFDLNQPTDAAPRLIALPSSGSNLSLAGRPQSDTIGIYERGTNEVFLVNVFAREESVLATTVTLPGPAFSAWFFDPGQLIWVDENGTLRVGDQVLSGEYTWARR